MQSGSRVSAITERTLVQAADGAPVSGSRFARGDPLSARDGA